MREEEKKKKKRKEIETLRPHSRSAEPNLGMGFNNVCWQAGQESAVPRNESPTKVCQHYLRTAMQRAEPLNKLERLPIYSNARSP